MLAAALMATPEQRPILQRLFKDSGMTYDQVAEATGLERMHAWRLINTGTVPEIDTLRKLVEGMGSTLAEFFVELEGGVPALFKHQGRKDLPASEVKADTAGSQHKDPHGHQFSDTDVTVIDAITATSDNLGDALDRQTDAINRLGTALGDISSKLDALIARVGTDDRSVSKTAARQANRRARPHDRVHKTG